MRTTDIRVALAALVLAGLAGVLFVEQQRVEKLRAENAVLRAQVGGLEALQTQQRQRADQVSATTDTARLREQQAELLRLRGEVTRLRNEARQNAARRATDAPPAAAAAPASAQTEADPVPFKAAAMASVGSGETFATGGWVTAPGSRTFLLATPTLGQSGPDGRPINIALCLLKVAEGDLPESILRKLQDQTQADSPVLTGTEAAFLLSKSTADEGTNVLSRPRIATSDGTPASMFFGQSRPNPDGTHRDIGTKIDISPQIAQDGQTIKMAVNLEYTPREENSEEADPAKAN